MSIPLLGSTGVGRAPARSALVGHGDIQAPPEFAEAVEQYARQNGRHGTMRFIPPINCWQIEFTLRPNDPGFKAWKEGRPPEALKVADPDLKTWKEPKEIVQLWDYVSAKPTGKEPPRIAELRRNALRRGMKLDQYVGYKLMDLGVTGLIQFLEAGNTWGRGRHASHEAAAADQWKSRLAADEKIAAAAKSEALDRGMEHRRQVLKIPYHGVGIDLQTAPESAPGAKK